MRKFILIFLCASLCLHFASCNKPLQTGKTEASSNDTETVSNTDSTEDIMTKNASFSVTDGKLDFPDEMPEYVEVVDYNDYAKYFDDQSSMSSDKKVIIRYYSETDEITNFFKSMDVGTPIDLGSRKQHTGDMSFSVAFCYKDGLRLTLSVNIGNDYIGMGDYYDVSYYDISAYVKDIQKLLAWP